MKCYLFQAFFKVQSLPYVYSVLVGLIGDFPLILLILLFRKEEGDVVEEDEEQKEEADQQPHGVEEGLEVLVLSKWSHQLLHNRTRATMTLTLPAFVPNRPQDLHLIGPVVRGAMTRAVDFFQLFFTDLLQQQICDHTNAYGWVEIVNKPYYVDRYGAWKETTPDEIAKLIALICTVDLSQLAPFIVIGVQKHSIMVCGFV